MGSSSSKQKTVCVLPKATPLSETENVPPPGLPSYLIDDIKVPISCYSHDHLTEDDGLDWSQITNRDQDERDVQDLHRRNTRYGKEREPPTIIKQPPPSTIRPIRSITLLGKEKGRSTSRQMQYSLPVHRSPSLRRKSTHSHCLNAAKLDFTDIDRHAYMAKKSHRKSYDDLIHYLLEPIHGKELQDILKARILIAWLANQKPKSSVFKADTSTPDGLLISVASGTTSYSSAYVTLCRKAGLTCKLVEGVSKSYDYIPSENITRDMEDFWTAVYCEDSWQLVHPNKICKVDAGKTRTEWQTKVLLDDYFMPSPEYFIFTCFPVEESWQLLPRDCMVSSTSAFLKLPCIFPSFFKLGLILETEVDSIIYSKNGKCEFDFYCTHKYDSLLSVAYNLVCTDIGRDSESMEHISEPLNAFVLHSRQNQRFHFEISLPFCGKYRLEIFGCYFRSVSLRLCQFTIVCSRSFPCVSCVPFSTKHMMWGPGFACDEAGLLVPSQMVGIVAVPMKSAKNRNTISIGINKYHTARFIFLLHQHKTKDVDFFAYLRHKRIPITKNGKKPATEYKKGDTKKVPVDKNDNAFYADFVACKRDHEKQTLEITVRIVHDGDFGLMITKRKFRLEKNKTKVFLGGEQAVCAYLLRASEEVQYDNVHQRLARERMVSLIYDDDRMQLLAAMEKCRKVQIDANDGDLYSAEAWCEYLEHKTNLNDCLHRRNIRIIDETLAKVAKYRYKGALEMKIGRVFDLRKRLVQLGSLGEYVTTLKEAAIELANILEPTPPVHVTMAAMLLMFGEIEKKVEDWCYIKRQMVVSDGMDEPFLIRKARLASEIYVSKNDSRKIMSLLTEYSVNEIHAANPWAAYFHSWACKVMSVLNETDTKDVTIMSEPEDVIVPDQNNDQLSEKSLGTGLANSYDSSRYEQNQNNETKPGNTNPEPVAFNTWFEKKKVTVPPNVREEVGIQTD